MTGTITIERTSIGLHVFVMRQADGRVYVYDVFARTEPEARDIAEGLDRWLRSGWLDTSDPESGWREIHGRE